jgi:hypothetical protein
MIPFKATWNEAWNYCCLYDMQLVTVHTSTRRACLTKFLRGFVENLIIFLPTLLEKIHSPADGVLGKSKTLRSKSVAA